MDLLKKMNLKGNIEELPKAKIPTTSDTSMCSMSAVVENKPQLLRPINPMLDCVKPAPSFLSLNAQFVFNGLMDCFKKQGFVKEGIAKDILWGFQVSYPDDLPRVAYGMVDLRRDGYITFIAPDGVEVDEHCTNLQECWVHYTEKFINHVYGI